MADPAFPAGVRRPDFYVAAMGRSGSTMLCNWLSHPPEQLVFVEPFFTRPANPRLLRIQLEDYGIAATDEEWNAPASSGDERFRSLMASRLQGRRWAFKEVLAEEHARAIDVFRPRKVLITVRHIADVALSFFEKHRLQGNVDRFDDAWVSQYCVREAAALVALRDRLISRGASFLIVRYEDFTAHPSKRGEVAAFVGWKPGGRIDAHLARFDRAFEVERHGKAISPRRRLATERALDSQLLAAAGEIERRCSAYQQAFGYA